MSSGLVIGLVAGLAVAALVIFCCVRSVCKEKKAITRQVKQVQQVDEDSCFDDVEAPTPPSERNTGSQRVAKTTTTSTTAAATAYAAMNKVSPKSAPAGAPVPAAKSRAPAPVHDAPPSYDELQATTAAAAAADSAVESTPTPEHVYGDDYEEFQGRHEYQTSADPYDAPVRVSRSTERRSGSLRQLSPEAVSRTSSLTSSRGRSAVKESETAVLRVS